MASIIFRYGDSPFTSNGEERAESQEIHVLEPACAPIPYEIGQALPWRFFQAGLGLV